MKDLFYTYLYTPIYNLLIFFVDVVPGGDVGIAVILVTLVVKLILSPLTIGAAETGHRTRLIAPQLKEIQKKYKDNREKLALETLALYKNNGIRPFASIFGSLLQIPVVLALYLVFHNEQLLSPNTDLIYSFITYPAQISPLFLGIFPTTGHVLILALIAAAVQYLQGHLSIPIPKKEAGTTPATSEEFARAMSIQARFLIPVIIGVVAYISGALAIYFITSSVFGIAQEYYVRYKLRDLGGKPATT
jgi:YidC/Oxa1 family membrane protein insertase